MRSINDKLVSFSAPDQDKKSAQPVAGQVVNFTLNTDVGGISLTPVSGTTNSSGEVQTVVNRYFGQVTEEKTTTDDDGQRQHRATSVVRPRPTMASITGE